jgi:hypothetical protein
LRNYWKPAEQNQLKPCTGKQGTARTEGLAKPFFVSAAETITAPWTLSSNADFVFPQTQGARPPDLEEGRRYFAALDALCAEDAKVFKLLSEVSNWRNP